MQAFGTLTRAQWHQRYVAQAGWTAYIRQHIFEKIQPQPGDSILEVGSGTGAILTALQQEGMDNLIGIDLDFPSLTYSKEIQPHINSISGDGHRLPFNRDEFVLSLCHYLLMWTKNPQQVIQEMQRVTRSGGWVLALAEPDHQSRIDFPPPLDNLGQHQAQSLQSQGADIAMGRKLQALFNQSGLLQVESGVLAAQWSSRNHAGVDDTEWTMLHADLAPCLSPSELTDYQQQDRLAWQSGKRVLYVPTFYALGKVP